MATMDSSVCGLVHAVAAGTATINAQYSGFTYIPTPHVCTSTAVTRTGSSGGSVVTASITVNLGPPPSTRTSSLSSGDNLSFSKAGLYCGATLLGAQGCSAGWVWQVEVAGTVSDNATSWVVTQDSNSETYTIHYTDFTSNTTTAGYTRDNPGSSFVQQISGEKSIFWLDAPGIANASNIASTDDQESFTSRICSTTTSTTCVCVDWNYHLLGNKNLAGTPTVETSNSTASITKASYDCQPQK